MTLAESSPFRQGRTMHESPLLNSEQSSSHLFYGMRLPVVVDAHAQTAWNEFVGNLLKQLSGLNYQFKLDDQGNLLLLEREVQPELTQDSPSGSQVYAKIRNAFRELNLNEEILALKEEQNTMVEPSITINNTRTTVWDRVRNVLASILTVRISHVQSAPQPTKETSRDENAILTTQFEELATWIEKELQQQPFVTAIKEWHRQHSEGNTQRPIRDIQVPQDGAIKLHSGKQAMTIRVSPDGSNAELQLLGQNDCEVLLKIRKGADVNLAELLQPLLQLDCQLRQDGGLIVVPTDKSSLTACLNDVEGCHVQWLTNSPMTEIVLTQNRQRDPSHDDNL